jgi:tRNA(Ile)-lysidine synthase
MAFTQEEFDHKIADLIAIESGGTLACAVSGGPDSMALLYLLSRFAEPRGVHIKAFTVDHGLRSESAEEARKVAGWCAALPNVDHEILHWSGDKPESRVLEEARAARYALLAGAMKRVGAQHLFVAHHQDDQAETFLIRLAKGSGLDGLSGMRSVQILDEDKYIVRPLLDAAKADLIGICDGNNIAYVNDPTNENQNYLRPRLRAAKDILEEEGLSAKRLSVTAKRLLRAREALEDLAEDLFSDALKEKREGGFVLDHALLKNSHEELVLRVVLHAMDQLRPDSDYGPRMEKAETLLERILHDPAFNGATLGGCIFAMDRKHGTVWIGKE